MSYYTFYDGVLDHLRINSDKIHLWQPEQKYGEELFHANRRFLDHPTSPAYAATFFGSGGIWHKMGQFRLNVSTVGIGLEFRTLHQNGMLLEVLNESDASVLEVFLQNGYVRATLRNALSQETRVDSRR